MSKIILHEVGMRDGLQMEQQVVPLDKKIQWLDVLMNSGMDIIQVGSFVHPGKVPQMADTDRLFQHYGAAGCKPAGVKLSALVLNEKGLERGLACGVELFCMGVSASETHSWKNTGMSIAEATDRILSMAREALASGRQAQVSVQSAFGCGYEGPVAAEKVLAIVGRFLEAGFENISLADTAGHATPDQVTGMFQSIFQMNPKVECAGHFHNTYGLGLANCCAAQQVGVRYFETAVGGLGGCPFTKVAGGNVCTEDFVHYLQRTGQRQEVNLDGLLGIARDMELFFGRELPGMVYKAGPIRRTTAG
jgi:hydroxymethylglutaryl-CoA lyase